MESIEGKAKCNEKFVKDDSGKWFHYKIHYGTGQELCDEITDEAIIKELEKILKVRKA